MSCVSPRRVCQAKFRKEVRQMNEEELHDIIAESCLGGVLSVFFKYVEVLL